MSSYNCCISQDPPSPEVLPSRPVKLSTDAVPVASWNTASRLSKPEDVAELRALFEGDNSDIDEEENITITAKKSSSTLDAVKSRLRKHLSRESALSKHPPRSTVGNSDEEVQRRKELRFIRNRRIREELSSKGAYDEDAKSLSTLATEKSPYWKPWPMARNENADYLEPLEMVSSPSLLTRKSDDGFYMREPSLILTIQRRHSLTALDGPKPLMMATTDGAVGRCSLEFPMPSTPMLKPQRLPSIVDPATRRTSWRLSFVSDQRATHLRALSQEYGLSPSGVGSGTCGNLAGPLRWFRAQGIRGSPSATATISDRLSAPDSPTSQAMFRSDLDDYEGVDGNTEIPTAPISLFDMRISQRLASRSLHSHSSSPPLSSWCSQSHHRRDRSYTNDGKATSQSTKHHSASNSGSSDSKVSTRRADILRDGTSSFYRSTDNSEKQTLESSGVGLPSLLATNERQVYFPSLDSQETSTVLQGVPIIATTTTAAETKMSVGNLSIPSARQDRQYTIENYMLASETLSFDEREVEFDMIQTRFPNSMEKSGRTSSVRSKFNEDFSEQQVPSPTTAREKPSLSTILQLPRIAKLVSRSYDDASPFKLQAPSSRLGFGYTFSNSSHSTADKTSPGARSPATRMPSSPARYPSQVHGDDPEGIWAQDSKRTKEEYESHGNTELSPVKREGSDGHGGFWTIRSVSRKVKGKDKASLDSLKELEIKRLPIEGGNFELESGLR